MGWIKVNDFKTGAVLCISPFFNAMGMCLGYLDGSIEYRSGQSLQTTTAANILFPELELTESNECTNNQNTLPIIMEQSPNGLLLMTLNLCRDNPNLSIIELNEIKIPKMKLNNSFGMIAPKLTELILSTYYNRNDASDLSIILSQLNSLSDLDIIQEITPHIFQYFKKPNLSFFEINTASSVVGDCVMVQHLLLSYFKINQMHWI
jgi:hypothetical protein